MKNRNIILFGIITLVLLIGSVGFFLFKPKIELNQSINYIKEGEYEKAYNCASKNEKNKKIIQEVISGIYAERVTSGVTQMTQIANEATQIILKTNKTNIDYTADDRLNIRVEQLDDYIAIETKIKLYMLISELEDTHELYFDIMKRVRANFYDVLNNLDYISGSNEIEKLVEDTLRLAYKTQSATYNHDYMAESNKLLQSIKGN